MIPHPQSMPWQIDPYGLLHRLFWNEKLEDPEEGIFRVLGVVHLYATSGIHLYAFLHTFQSFSFPWVKRFDLDVRWLKRFAIASALLLLLWAWSLQDFRAGFARPLVTFFIRWWGRQHGAKFRIFAPLLVTLGFDLLFDFGGGRGHYYLAIAGGLFALERLEKKTPTPTLWKTHLALAWGSWILTAPLDLLEHHRISWMTPIYSLLTIPPLAHFLYPGSLLSLFFFNSIRPSLLECWSSMMNALVWVADHTPGPLMISTAALGVGLGFSILALRFSQYRLGLMILALALRPLLPEASMLVQLDVKQGDALLLRTPMRIEAVDVGPEWALRSSAWVDQHFYYGVDHLDSILLTHLDADHAYGLRRLLPWIRVGCIETHEAHWKSDRGRELRQWLQDHFPETELATQGCFQSGRVAWFRSQTDHESGNQLMAGWMMPLTENRVYLSVGDGDQSQERQYWKTFSPAIAPYRERIWKISHHGSRYSSDPQVLAQMEPTAVWISVGRKNPYRHPSNDTLRRLEVLKVRVQRTDVAGDLSENISQPSRLRILEKWLRR